MKSKNIQIIPFRRKREGKTDYRTRLALLKSGSPRLVVRKTNKNMILQIVEYDPSGDKVMVSVNSKELEGYGWTYSKSNIPAAYLAGYLLGKKAGKRPAILDLGLQTPIAGSKLFAAAKGAIDGGIDMPLSEEVIPTEDRMAGKHVADYASSLDEESYPKVFSGYAKKKADPKEMGKAFQDAKKRIDDGIKK